MKKGLLLILAIITNLLLALTILSFKSDWAVVVFVLYIISLIYLTLKIIKND